MAPTENVMAKIFSAGKCLIFLICLLHTTASCSANNSEFRIAIDIGHSDKSPGALSSRGIYEHTFNKRLAAELLAAIKQAGYKNSFLINENGDMSGNAGLRQRTVIAQQQQADLFISIHHDSIQETLLRKWDYDGLSVRYNDEIEGYSIIFSSHNSQPQTSLLFAELLGDELLTNNLIPTDYHAMDIPGERRNLIDKKRGIYDIEFWVVAQAEMPSVLFEAGMIINRDEELKLNSAKYRNRIIQSFISSIKKFENNR